MKTRILVISLFLLVGCGKLERPFRLGLIPATVTKSHFVLVAGQSNAGRLYTEGGLGGWESVLHNNDSFMDCSEAGTDMLQWLPGRSGAGSLQRCMTKVGAKVPDIIIWYQGEADALNPGLTPDYTENTIKLFRYFQQNWPKCQIVFAQLHTVDPVRQPGFYGWDDIKAQQSHINLTGTVMVRTDDIHPGPCDAEGDGIHYPPDGAVLLGRRFAHGYKQLLAGE